MDIPMASALGSSSCLKLPGIPVGIPMASALGRSFCSKLPGSPMGIPMGSALFFAPWGGLVAKHY